MSKNYSALPVSNISMCSCLLLSCQHCFGNITTLTSTAAWSVCNQIPACEQDWHLQLDFESLDCICGENVANKCWHFHLQSPLFSFQSLPQMGWLSMHAVSQQHTRSYSQFDRVTPTVFFHWTGSWASVWQQFSFSPSRLFLQLVHHELHHPLANSSRWSTSRLQVDVFHTYFHANITSSPPSSLRLLPVQHSGLRQVYNYVLVVCFSYLGTIDYAIISKLHINNRISKVVLQNFKQQPPINPRVWHVQSKVFF